MAAYTVKLKDRKEIAAGTLAFSFEKPADFTFKAGQFVQMTLLDPPETDAEGNRRDFSIASAPHEEDLLIATRMCDTAFKRVLNAAPLGTEVKIQGPYGYLILHGNAARPAVFLAGGIGITPFRSMILRAAEEKLDHRILLFYANRGPDDAAFLEELQALQEKNPNYTSVLTMTAVIQEVQTWDGETGYITKEMLAKYIGELSGPMYYIAGPPRMVGAMQETLSRAGISDDDIRPEDFPGY